MHNQSISKWSVLSPARHPARIPENPTITHTENPVRINTMTKRFVIALMLLLPVLAFAQSSSTPAVYQPATITNVRLLQSAGNSTPDDALYEVSVRVGQTIYLVLTAGPSPAGTVIYAVGRQLLVRIDSDTITWNDIMGQSYKASIISRTLIGDTSKPKG